MGPYLTPFYFLITFIYLFISVLHRYAHAMAHVEVKGQFLRVISLLPPGRVWESDSGCQAWQQVPSPTKPSLTPLTFLMQDYFKTQAKILV